MECWDDKDVEEGGSEVVCEEDTPVDEEESESDDVVGVGIVDVEDGSEELNEVEDEPPPELSDVFFVEDVEVVVSLGSCVLWLHLMTLRAHDACPTYDDCVVRVEVVDAGIDADERDVGSGLVKDEEEVGSEFVKEADAGVDNEDAKEEEKELLGVA